MKKDWFTTKYRIMPVYADNKNKQVAVIVEVKHSFIHEFVPMNKICLGENNELMTRPAIFDNEDDAKSFISHLTETA